MKTIKKLIIVACTGALVSVAAHAEKPTPEQAADINLQMVVKQDRESIDRYVSYMSKAAT